MRISDRQGDGAVDKQLIADLDEAGTVMGADQHGAKAGAIDEQVAGDARALLAMDRGDIAVAVGFQPRHIGQDVGDAQLLRAMIAQEGGELAGVEVVGIGSDRLELWRR